MLHSTAERQNALLYNSPTQRSTLTAEQHSLVTQRSAITLSAILLERRIFDPNLTTL